MLIDVSDLPAIDALDDDLLAQLLEVNLDVAKRSEADEAVTSPGVPTVYPDPAQLFTDDCIRPVE
ncbi:MAG: hypothetical protein QGG09_01735 [Pirellulaceae bacterium]|nr:hypothetical protein [Pirellulaceae bacterium]